MRSWRNLKDFAGDGTPVTGATLTRRLFGSMVRRIAAALASRVGEPTTGSDFREERG